MLKAQDIMIRTVVTAKASDTIKELARMLIDHRISGAPVTDEQGNLLGIVTENDLISQNKRLHIPTVLRLFDAYIMLESPDKIDKEIRKIAAVTVGDICTRDVITVAEDTPLEEVAAIMSEKNVHLIPVVRDKKILGIIGKMDLIVGMLKK